MWKCQGLVGFMIALSCWAGASPVSAAEVFLGVTRSETARIPASFVHLQASSALVGQETEVREVLEMDLRRSLVFRMVKPPNMPEIQGAENPKPDLIKKVGAEGIEAVIWATLSKRGQDLVLEGRVYDGGSGTMMVGKRYIGEAKALRTMTHRFSDEIVFRYTGERGIAQTRIVYTSNLTGAKELYLMDYDGGNAMRLTEDRSLSLSPEWSSDGRWITYTSYRDGNPDIFTLDLETVRRWKMIGFPGLNISPAWSPTGDRLAFASTRDGISQLYLADREGKGLVKLTAGLGDSLSPTWSPSGQEIAFVSNRGGTPQIYLMNSDGTNVRRLTFSGVYNTSPAWSPKGDWIAYACRVENRMRICLINPDGTQQVQLTDGAAEQEDPSWSPDGRHLVFRSTLNGPGDLYMMNEDGQDMERLTFNGMQNSSPAWSPFIEK